MRRMAADHDMRADPGAGADLDVLADDRIGADLDVRARAARRDGRWRSGGSLHVMRSARTVHISSASAATWPSTLARRGEFPDAALGGDDRDFEDQLVAGLDRPLEARAVDADEVVDRLVVGLAAHGLEGQDRRRLRQRLDDQHARHHRMVRESGRGRTAR